MNGFIDFILGLSIFVAVSIGFIALNEMKRQIAELRAVTRWIGVRRSEDVGMDDL